MAKKKGKKGKSKRSKGMMGINTSKLIGMAGGVYGESKIIKDFLAKYITDPKMAAVAYIAIGEFAPKQDFVRGIVKDQDILDGVGNAFTVIGIKNLLAEMGIAGVAGANDQDELAVVIEGIEDADMDEDILGEDDDLNVVNEDVLGDDDLNVVNEDILGDDEDLDY